MKTKFFNTILFTLFTLGSIFAQKVNPLIVAVSAQQPTCYGFDDGSISLNLNGGQAPYTYLWSNGQTGQSISNLTSGDYSVTITDAAGQVVGGVFTLPQPQQITIQSIKTNVSATGLSDGSIDIVSVNNTSGNWSYIWSSNGGTYNPTSLDQTNLSVGDYKLTIIDANGCELTKNYQIRKSIVLKPIQLNTTSSMIVYPNPSNGNFSIDFKGEELNYRIVNINSGFEVSNGKSNGEKIDFSNLPTGNYIIYTEKGNQRFTII